MAAAVDSNVRSRMVAPSVTTIAGHPIHPTIVPLPIGFLVAATISDVAYAATKDRFWARSARWLMAAGAATGLVAGAAGANDFLGIERARSRRDGWIHGIGNLTALGITGVNLAVRRDSSKGVPAIGLILSLLTAAILTVTGWFGGELVFRHLVGPGSDPLGTPSPGSDMSDGAVGRGPVGVMDGVFSASPGVRTASAADAGPAPA